MNINDVNFGKSGLFFDVCVKIVFVLTSAIQFNIYSLYNFQEPLCIYVARNMGQFTYYKVASL